MANWPPLESNPEVLNKFASQCGVSSAWQFADVFGFDDELLAMVPQPCLAILFLFPSKCKTQFDDTTGGSKGFFLSQIPELDQACGTIAMIHGVANNLERLGITSGPIYDYIQKASKEDSPEKRGKMLVENETISSSHSSLAQEGQSQAVSEADHHFVCFTAVDGHLYEFDGLKPAPTDHGPLGDTPFLNKTAATVRAVYMKDPSVLDLAMISLGPGE
mmetsp:Transcript_24725/g.34016  ORF Transcript_24725/g.34016 Transcript_24725/m.34016 type:complete len:218 (-) Transcript_24725:56-709(-)|eukprot:CAMPEP_0201487302 /NCGR_PEP_ID=MMETSP0151_2-20130828/12197_1 /ASSEMBLY_ACC=CAM_ASM_000257 /TAXON_ID=200890 /ORGANISM="Paramoeba atlantica, Strain 621/1 / CCAP 1560/9" /LENGTH=217 /DNA_ID=CAMNT_0047872301 /DNA_START=39 /DNA_END=692 /DNA_ORIENTATION=+